MDSRRLILFIALSLGLMLLWDKYLAPKSDTQTTVSQTATSTVANNSATVADGLSNSTTGTIVNVTTDLMNVEISTTGGDIRGMELSKYTDYNDTSKQYSLLLNKNSRVFIAQTGLIGPDANLGLPNHKSIFHVDGGQTNFTMSPDQNTLKINLTAIGESGNVVVVKTYTFTRGNHLVE
mgnify:FL=1